MKHITRSTKTAIAATIVLFLAASAAYRGGTSGMTATQREGVSRSLPDFDLRLAQGIGPLSPTRSQRAAFTRLQRRVGDDLQMSFDGSTGTPRHLFSLASFLTPVSGDDHAEIALDFFRENSDLFRLTQDEIETLRVAKNYVTRHNGVTHLAFQQIHDGLEIFESDLRVNLAPDGRIVSVNGQYFPGSGVSLEPQLTAAEAVRAVVEDSFPDVAFSPVVKQAATGASRLTVFHRGDFADDVTTRLVLFPAADATRLGWRVRLHLPERAAWYDVVIDARSGELLMRHNLYVFEQSDGLVFDLNPDIGPNTLKPFTGDPTASPATWVSASPNTRLFGNNVMIVPAPVSAAQQFRYPFLNTYNRDGLNSFDLDGKTIRFTPNAAGGYDLSLVPFAFDLSLGTDITASLMRIGLADRNDGTAEFKPGFDFPFFGTNYSTLYINANGNVTFTGPSSIASESLENLTNNFGRIAAFWDDLDFRRIGALYAKTVGTPATKAVITWNAVPKNTTASTQPNTFQLTLSSNGVIEIAYNGASSADVIVGVTRGGGETGIRQVDISAGGPVTGSRDGLCEKFPSVEIEAAATNLFYQLNFMHDYLYHLGFDEAAGNFQVDNFGKGGLGNDPVIGYPQAAGTNNANFGTPEDGRSPTTRFYFFTASTFRQVDSDFDADVIYHEYTHGLTQRLVGGPQNVRALSTQQSGSMGEGWSDAYSCSITDNPITGEYSTGNRVTGIRGVAYDNSPLTYGDFGNRRQRTTAGIGPVFYAQVHSDGEIWATVLWDLRTALGKRVYERLITDGLKFTPPNPSMLDARDAILLADKMTNQSANTPAVWTVFAARGMGFSARSTSGDDTVIFEAFDKPDDPLPPIKTDLFADDMESGAGEWTVSPDNALWHLSKKRSAGGSTAWYYGQEATGNINTGTRQNYGALSSRRLSLPAITGNSALVLSFDHFLRRGDLTGMPFDCGYVRIIDSATGQTTQKAIVYLPAQIMLTQFQHEELNLSEFAGKTIQIQFYFDTIDGVSNTGEGWYIDNVRVSLRAR
jgi:hypothetical protein